MDVIELIDLLDSNQNLRAFEAALRLGEGTKGPDGYRTLFGGGLFDSYEDHPRVKVTRGRLTSTAAGAYQILAGTWDETASKYQLKDFSPRNQDIACAALIYRRGALDDVVAGRIEDAVRKCAREWASLPGSPYGQPTVSMAQFKSEYLANGGTYAAGTPPTTKEQPMIPFVAAALPAVVQAVPELIKMFGGDGQVTERNAKAAEQVLNIAKTAVDATNEQDLVEKLQSDPAAPAKVRAAVQDNWFQLQEVGGGIAAARDFNLKAQGDKGLLKNPAVWITVALLPLVYMVVATVMWGEGFSDELKVMVVTAVVSGVLGAITGYWLGTSASSAKKDDAMLKGRM